MEPLDLGPNAGSHPRAPLPPHADVVGTQQEDDDVYEVGDRFSLGELSVGSGRAESHGSSEVTENETSLQLCICVIIVVPKISKRWLLEMIWQCSICLDVREACCWLGLEGGSVYSYRSVVLRAFQ